MTFTYTRNRPNPPNNPSSDVPNMLTNTNSTDDLLNVDHFSFNVPNGGKHKQTQLVNGALPAGLIAGAGTLYTKSVGAASQLFYTRDASTMEIQMSSTGITPGVITPTFTPAAATTATYVTFLPGNTVLVSGTIQNSASVQQVALPFNMAAIISIQVTQFLNTGPTNRLFSYVDSLTAVPAGFKIHNLDSGGTPQNGFGVMWSLFGIIA